ncbi:MAG: site-specific integrase [Patescibacteria group bacterium]
MLNTNIVVSLDTRRIKKGNTYPVIMRLGHNERTTSIPIGISVQKKDWDDKNKIVKKSYVGLTSVTRLNNTIQKKKAEAMDVILMLHEAGQLNLLSVTALRDKIVRQNTSQSFFSFADLLIIELIKANRIGTARSYKGVISVLKTYCNEKDLLFHEITYAFLNRFETYHKSNGNGVNGLAVYMRTIRAIYNKAIKEGIVNKELYPFSDYKIRTAPTEKRALEWKFLKKITDLKLSSTHPCFDARNFFLASYMMYGMNFSDMAFLQKTDITNGRINYRRRKTSKLYDIKITKTLNTILAYYIKQSPESKYVFPIIKREIPIEQEKDIQWARKGYNKKLKDIAELCKIEKKLTSYVSRHSFATQAMLHHVPLNAISSMLGHSSLKTTEVYLKSLPSNILDNYNSMILDNS